MEEKDLIEHEDEAVERARAGRPCVTCGGQTVVMNYDETVRVEWCDACSSSVGVAPVVLP